jgi:hypothetical protein
MYGSIACRAPQPEASLVFKLGIHAFLAKSMPTSKHQGLPLLQVKSLEADVTLYQGLIEAAWQGACPSDFKPGDMEIPGGVRINLLDMGH